MIRTQMSLTETFRLDGTLLLAQNRGWTCLAVIFGIALLDVNTLDQWLLLLYSLRTVIGPDQPL